MKKVIFVFIITCFYFFPIQREIDIHFTPSTQCEQSIITLINNAKESIDIAVYSLNNDQIVNAIKRAHDRNIKLRILTDKLQAAGRYSKVIELYQYGVNIKVHTKHKIEHNKFAIYDKHTVSTGSYNWTNAASKKNSENCIFLNHDITSSHIYQNHFEKLWQINTKLKSDDWFHKRVNEKFI